MLSFMLSVLGSTLFWCIWISFSFFMTIIICKHKDGKMEVSSEIIDALVRGKIIRYPRYENSYEATSNSFDRATHSFLFMCLMIFWPVWVIVWITKYTTKYIFKFIEWIIISGLKHGPTIKLEVSDK